MGFTYYFQDPNCPRLTSWNSSGTDDLAYGYRLNRQWERGGQIIVAAEPEDTDWRKTHGLTLETRIEEIRRGERPGAYFRKGPMWYLSCPGNATLWKQDSSITVALSVPGPRKPVPALPVEVWNPRKVDTAAAWKAIQDLCKGT